MHYLHADHLGSAALVTCGSGSGCGGMGATVAQQRYYPWGAIRPGPDNTLPTDRLFTSQRWDEALSLYDYRARYYDPALGRFISADPVVPEMENPQALNRYAYVNNSPLRYTDPTGHYISLEDDFGVWVTRTGVVQVVRGGSHFANPVEVALANAILSGEPRHLAAIPVDAPSWAIQRSLVRVASELGYGGPGTGVGDLLLDPFLVAGMAMVVVGRGTENTVGFPEGLPAGERLGYTETPWDAAARNPNAISRWGERLVGQHLAVRLDQIRMSGRVYDGVWLPTNQPVEIKTTTRGIVYPNAHIRRQIAFDAAQTRKPLWIFVGGSPSRALQVELNKAGIPWQILKP